jgi:putative endopeptidase
MVAERNRYLLWQELDTASKSPKTPLEKKYGDYYAACMNTEPDRDQGPQAARARWPRSPALKDTKNLRSDGELASTGYSVSLFRFGVGQDEKDSTSRSRRPIQAGIRCLTATTTWRQ